MKRLKGLSNLIFDVIEETSNLVEKTQEAVVDRSLERYVPPPLASGADTLRGAIQKPTSLVFSTVRGVTKGVREVTDGIVDTALALKPELSERLEFGPPTPLRSDAAWSAPWLLDHLESMLNGAWGSHLTERGNPLDLGMTLRKDGRVVPIEPRALAENWPASSGRVAVFVHGSSNTEWSWWYRSEASHGDPSKNVGTLLEAELGFTPLYIRYNTGRHISENGRLLSDLLERLIEAFPRPLDDLVLFGHSMGGLVVRSAASYGQDSDAAWVSKLRQVFCLGAPHLGSYIEKGANILTHVLTKVEAAGAQVPATLLNTRSHGLKDLRHGYTRDEEWEGRCPDAPGDFRIDVPLVDGVGYYFVGATLSASPDATWGQLMGDVLVRPPSASGRAFQPHRSIPFRDGRMLGGMNHMHVANHPDTYALIRQWIESPESTLIG